MLAANGATVVLSDVSADKGADAARKLGAPAIFLPCDVADPAQVFALVDEVVNRFGRLDIMVNNAGINSNRPEDRVTADKYPIETWRRIIDIDLNGTFFGCKAAAAQMVKQQSGAIVNIASVAGVVALRLQIGYVAAKAAIIKMSEAMACELGPQGIRVNVVSPVQRSRTARGSCFYDNKERAEHILSFIPQRRPGETNEIAGAVTFLVSDAAAYINGHNIIVDGGWTCGFNRDF